MGDEYDVVSFCRTNPEHKGGAPSKNKSRSSGLPHPFGISAATLGLRRPLSSTLSSSLCALLSNEEDDRGIGNPPPPVEPSPRATTYGTTDGVPSSSSSSAVPAFLKATSVVAS